MAVICRLIPLMFVWIIVATKHHQGAANGGANLAPHHAHDHCTFGLYQSINDETLFQELSERIRGRPVNVKVGVWKTEKRDPSAFWVEFDPTNAYELNNDNVVLPFIAAAKAGKSVPFYEHSFGPCSSMYSPSNRSTNWTAFEADAAEVCAKLNMHSSTKLRRLTFECQSTNHVAKIHRFPAISLKSVVDSVPGDVGFMDIDAQGADFELILSLGVSITKVKLIMFECQYSRWMYNGPIRNDCVEAERHLKLFNFTPAGGGVNNCNDDEFNLVFKQN